MQCSVWTDGISDRGSYPNDAIGVEGWEAAAGVIVIQDVVVANFWSNKDVSSNVVAEAGAKVDQEMVAGFEIVAADRTGAVGQIEAGALQTDAPHEIKANLFSQPGLVYGVEIQDDGAIGLSAVRSLAGPPRGLKVEADTFMEDDVGVDTWVQTSLFRADTGCVARSRRQERAEAEHGISLLGLGEAGQEE
jgi:hypothetical protein